MATITGEAPAAEVARIWPETMRVFAQYKLDLCCGGAHPLNRVASKHGLDLEQLLEQLNAIVEEKAAADSLRVPLSSGAPGGARAKLTADEE